MNTNNTHKILIIQPLNDQNIELKNLLQGEGYEPIIVNSIELSIQKISDESFDLIICSNDFTGYDGFNIYKTLRTQLLNNGIPFFLFGQNIEKEDILIGLEMGIDNFFFTPINSKSILSKAKIQLKKHKEISIFKTDGFKNYFFSSTVAMFYLLNNKIELVNDAFNKLYCKNEKGILKKQLSDLFDINSNPKNHFNYRRFINGLSDSCNLRNVKCNTNSSLNLDVSLYRGNSSGLSAYFAEMVPSNISSFNNSYNELEKSPASNFQKTDRFIEETEMYLTEREKEIIKLSSKGLPVKIIADKLKLSKRTVEKHRSNILNKTHANNIIEAIHNISKNGYSSLVIDNF